MISRGSVTLNALCSDAYLEFRNGWIRAYPFTPEKGGDPLKKLVLYTAMRLAADAGERSTNRDDFFAIESNLQEDISSLQLQLIMTRPATASAAPTVPPLPPLLSLEDQSSRRTGVSHGSSGSTFSSRRSTDTPPTSLADSIHGKLHGRDLPAQLPPQESAGAYEKNSLHQRPLKHHASVPAHLGDWPAKPRLPGQVNATPRDLPPPGTATTMGDAVEDVHPGERRMPDQLVVRKGIHPLRQRGRQSRTPGLPPPRKGLCGRKPGREDIFGTS